MIQAGDYKSEQILEAVADSARKGVGAEVVTIYLKENDESDYLVSKVAHFHNAEPTEIRYISRSRRNHGTSTYALMPCNIRQG